MKIRFYSSEFRDYSRVGYDARALADEMIKHMYDGFSTNSAYNLALKKVKK